VINRLFGLGPGGKLDDGTQRELLRAGRWRRPPGNEVGVVDDAELPEGDVQVLDSGARGDVGDVERGLR
jgi:hypothetical protein